MAAARYNWQAAVNGDMRSFLVNSPLKRKKNTLPTISHPIGSKMAKHSVCPK